MIIAWPQRKQKEKAAVKKSIETNKDMEYLVLNIIQKPKIWKIVIKKIKIKKLKGIGPVLLN